MRKLTAPQQRYLHEIRESGEKVYNGRARRSLEVLRDAGLIEFDYDLRPHVGAAFTELFVARPTAATEDGRHFALVLRDSVREHPKDGDTAVTRSEVFGAAELFMEQIGEIALTTDADEAAAGEILAAFLTYLFV